MVRVGDGVAYVRGVPSVRYGELLERGDGLTALAFDLRPHEVGVLFLDPSEHVAAGDELRATGRVASVPVGDELLGRVVDALGRPLDGGPPLRSADVWPVEREAPGVIDRQPVREPLHTGIKVIDALLPLGRGPARADPRRPGHRQDRPGPRRHPGPARQRRAVRLRRHRPAQGQRRRGRRTPAPARRAGAHGGRGGRRRLAAGPAVPGAVHRLHDRRILHATGAGTSWSSTTT